MLRKPVWWRITFEYGSLCQKGDIQVKREGNKGTETMPDDGSCRILKREREPENEAISMLLLFLVYARPKGSEKSS